MVSGFQCFACWSSGVRNGLALLLMVCWLGPLLAQSDTVSIRPHPFSLGYLNGVNVMRMVSGKGNAATHELLNAGPKIGVDIGLILQWQLRDRFRLRLFPTVSLVQFQYRIVQVQSGGSFVVAPPLTWQSDYLMLPLMVQYGGSHSHKVRPWVQLGVQPKMAVMAIKGASGYLQRHPLDVGVVVGAGVDICGSKISLSPEIRFQQGLIGSQKAIPIGTGQVLPNLFSQVLSLNICLE